MKKFVIILSVLIRFNLFAQEASVVGVNTQGFLRDEKNIIRYNPLNILDNKSDTVYAINKKEFTKIDPLIQIFFCNDVLINQINIKNGYFDSRYYKLNYRIKSGTVKLLYQGKTVLEKYTFNLNDEMKEQSIVLDNDYKVTEVQIFVNDFYQYEKWDDIVISDIVFLLNNNKYINRYGLTDNCYLTYEEKNTFNKNGNIESKYEHYPKFFGVNYYYYYDIQGRLLLEFESTPDGPGGKYTYYEYPDNKGKYPIIIHQLKNISFLEKNDDIINPVKIDKNGNLFEYKDYKGTTYYQYNSQNKLEKKIIKKENPNIIYNYYYQDGKCVLEEYSNWIYIYLYNENDQLEYKIPIVTNNAECQFFKDYKFDTNKNLVSFDGYSYRWWIK